MAFDISYTFDAIDKFTSVANNIGQSVSKLQSKFGTLQNKIRESGESIAKTGRSLFLKLTLPILGAGAGIIKIGDDIDILQDRFMSVSKSADEATKFFRKLADFTIAAPFKLPEVSNAAIRLRSLGFSANDTLKTMKILGEVSSGTGADLNTLSEYYGRAKESAQGAGRALLMFIEMGIPIATTLKEMAKQQGHVNINLQKLASQGQITFPVLQEAFRRMTAEHGVFYHQTERQAKEIGALFGSLKTAIEVDIIKPLKDAIIEGTGLDKIFVRAIKYIQAHAEQFKKFLETHKELIKIGLLLAGFLAALGPILIIVGMIVVGFSLLLNPITIVIGLLGVMLGNWIHIKLQHETVSQLLGEIKSKIIAIKNYFLDHLSIIIQIVKYVLMLLIFNAIARASLLFFVVLSNIASVLKVIRTIILAIDVLVPELLIIGLIAVALLIAAKHSKVLRDYLLQIYNFWKAAALKIMDFFKPIISIFHFLDKLSDKFARAPRRMTLTQIGHTMLSTAGLRAPTVSPLQHRITSDININVKDPGKIVKEVGASAKGAGNVKVKTGRNMILSAIGEGV